MNESNPNLQKSNYDLEERTARFAESVIDMAKKIQITPINKRIIEQIIGSSGSVGANYCEANESESKKDFQNKIFICKKEAKETLYWLELMGKSIEDDKQKEQCRKLWQEAKEFILIFGKIASSTKK